MRKSAAKIKEAVLASDVIKTPKKLGLVTEMLNQMTDKEIIAT